MGNKTIGATFLFIGIILLIFGIVTTLFGTAISSVMSALPEETVSQIESRIPFFGIMPVFTTVFGIIEIITALLSFVAGISLIRYKEE